MSPCPRTDNKHDSVRLVRYLSGALTPGLTVVGFPHSEGEDFRLIVLLLLAILIDSQCRNFSGGAPEWSEEQCEVWAQSSQCPPNRYPATLGQQCSGT